MKRTLLAFALAIGGLFTATGTADAQYPIQSTWINPWTPYANYGVTTYSPYAGISARSFAYDPWSGSRFYQSNFVNPNSGFRRSYSYGYNPWLNTYQYQYNYRNPRFGTPFGYWR